MENDFDVAIVGMAGRFPGAKDLAEFWQNLMDGVESIARLSAAELAAAGVAPETFNRPDYVKASPVLEDPALFDAAFFGFSPGEAANLDPQHRLLLELAQLALDDAGCDPDRFKGRIGVFAGSAMNTYFGDRGMDERLAENYIPTLVATDKDFLATRISYKLGLRGPSLTVQTACSTSLVAIHLARQSLLNEETDLALAGAVSVRVPHRAGYFYDGSGVVSPDGHVRAFDDGANGTVFGSGAGIVVLKRLADALAQGDSIYAVIKGSAVNNDGSSKAGYTAPSVSGQTDAIIEALANAGVSAEELSYVEAHGSGTPVGDRIELLALSQAFRQFTPRTGFCTIGSVKTNVGHLDAAAGMAGLIKTALALQHGRIPPTLHYTKPNAEIDFPATPFVVNTAVAEWPRCAAPRRAGLMATGMGGTNAYVVLEEAPAAAPAAETNGPQLLIWSAKTPAALEAVTARLAARMTVSLAEAAQTLQSGRRNFAHRRFLVAGDAEDARRELANPKSPRVFSGSVRDAAELPVVFLLPGMGDQYVDMGRGLYDKFATFRAEIDRCAELLLPLIGTDLREILYPAGSGAAAAASPARIDLKRMLGRTAQDPRDPAESRLDQTRYNQPALFAVEYALARLWMEWGVQPARLVGHSMGEYVAACLAGVFSLADALRLIVSRAELVEKLPGGAMVAVMLSETELLPLLGPELSISLINGPKLCVVAGTAPAVEEFQARLKARQIIYRSVRNTHAFHSRLLDPIVQPFIQAMSGVRFSAPQIPFISNVTGTWITPEQAVDPRYWADHARRTARFGDALGHIAKLAGMTLLEVGPGRTLGVLAAQHPAWPLTNKPLVVSSLRQSYENYPDREVMLGSAGRLWLQGIGLEWERMGLTGGARKARLPGYPFERTRHWLERMGRAPGVGGRSVLSVPPPDQSDIGNWFYLPSWQRAGIVEMDEGEPAGGLWLIVADQPSAEWTGRLRERGAQVVVAVLGQGIRKRNFEDYLKLAASLPGRVGEGLNIIHAVNHAEDGFYSLLLLAQAIAEKLPTVKIKLAALSAGVQEVTGAERLIPDGALSLGLCGVIGRELTNVTAFAIDRLDPAAECPMVVREFESPVNGAVLAYRGRYRWRRSFERRLLPAPAAETPVFRPRGVYLITGGTGGIGLAIARHLASTVQARLVLMSRQPQAAEALKAIAAAGGEVLVQSGDVARPADMDRVIAATLRHFGALHGVIHAAGIVRDGVLQLKTPQIVEAVLRPKVEGTKVLYRAVKDLPLDLLVLFSSISAVIPRHGQGDYCAANAFLDAFAAYARSERNFRTVVINWPGWREVGILAGLKNSTGPAAHGQADRERAIATADGLEAFRRIVASPFTQIIVSPQDLTELEAELAAPPAVAAAPVRTREVADEPQDELEKAVGEIWSAALGLAPIGRNENFIELGGHSLLAMRIVAQIRTNYQIDYTLRKFFEHPSIAATASAIQAEVVAEIEALPDDEVTKAAP